MAIAFVDSNTKIKADRWNDLFSELDTKIARAMDSKSIVMLPNPIVSAAEMKAVMGMLFFFVNGERKNSVWLGGSNYKHQPFVDAASTLAASTVFDADAKVIQLDAEVPSSYRDQVDMGDSSRFFDRSLQAHRKIHNNEPYWIIEPTSGSPTYRPEKIYKYAQAEIILEGIGFEDFLIDPAWDKYNFFRIHNCNPYSATVSFAGKFSITIPRWESRCVRRDSVSSGYLEGYKYFHKMKSGEPRVFRMPQSNSTPHGSMGANNVISPSIAYEVIELFVGGRVTSGPKLWVDPHHLYDISSLYPTEFPTINDDVIIGDLLHHRGKLKHITYDPVTGTATEEELDFKGYSDLKNAFPLKGINVTVNGDGSLSLQSADATKKHDLIGIGSNLLNQNGTLKPVVNVSDAAYKLDTHAPSSDAVRPAVARQRTETYVYNTVSELKPDGTVALDVLKTVAVENDYVALSENTLKNFTNTISIHQHTVEQIKSLNAWGDPDIGGQDTNRGTFKGRALVLTPFGLVLKFEQQIPLDFRTHYPYGSGSVITGSTVDAMNDDVRLDDKVLVFQKTITFDGYGWPTLNEPAFVGPRKARVVSNLATKVVKFTPGALVPSEVVGGVALRHHPNVDNQPYGKDGADLAIIPLKRSQKKSDTTSIKVLTPLTLSYPHNLGAFFANPFDFQIYASPDVLDEFVKNGLSSYGSNRDRYLSNTRTTVRMIRMNLLREHYNALANYINAIKKCRPFTFPDWIDGFSPNSNGPFGGKYRPANAYAAFDRDSDLWNRVRRLGIPIKTKDDLPASYKTAKETPQQTMYLQTSFTEQKKWKSTQNFSSFEDGNLSKPIFAWEHTYELKQVLNETKYSKTNFAFGQVPSLLTPSLFEGTHTDEVYYWVTVDDVKAKAEELGFLFHLERTVVPHKIQIYDLDANKVDRQFVSKSEILLGEHKETTSTPQPDPDKSVLYQQPDTFHLTPFIPANYIQMTEALTDDEVEWIRDADAYRVVDYRAGDVMTAHINPVVGVQVGRGGQFVDQRNMETRFILFPKFVQDEYRFLRQHKDFIRTSKTPNINPYQASIFPDSIYQAASVLHQSWVSDGLSRSSKAVDIPVPWVKHSTERYSAESYRNAVARLTYGPVVIPLSVERPQIASTGQEQPY